MWNAFVAWFQSAPGQRVLDSAVVPALAILIAGVVAALIARGAVRALLARADRDAVAGSVAALVEAARVRASGRPDRAEEERVDRLRSEADIRLRMARPRGAALAADWASLRLDAIERDATSPVPQGAAAADEVRERLLAWIARPKRAKRLFASDIERLGAERDSRRGGPEIARAASPKLPAGGAAEAPSGAPAAAPETKAADDETGSAAVAARLKTHKGRIENQPEPVSAREQNRRDEPSGEQPAARAEPAPGDPDQPPPSTEPVLVQRTRLDSLDRSGEDAPLDHARHARAAALAATAVATSPAEPDAAPAPPAPEREPVPEAPAAGAAPAADEQPAPTAQIQPVPAWLDTYDDEADVTRDIDLSKTPPPMSASAVRDRTRTGDDIVPRH